MTAQQSRVRRRWARAFQRWLDAPQGSRRNFLRAGWTRALASVLAKPAAQRELRWSP